MSISMLFSLMISKSRVLSEKTNEKLTSSLSYLLYLLKFLLFLPYTTCLRFNTDTAPVALGLLSGLHYIYIRSSVNNTCLIFGLPHRPYFKKKPPFVRRFTKPSSFPSFASIVNVRFFGS